MVKERWKMAYIQAVCFPLATVKVGARDVPPKWVVAASRGSVWVLESCVREHYVAQSSVRGARPPESQGTIGRSDVEAQGSERHSKIGRIDLLLLLLLYFIVHLVLSLPLLLGLSWSRGIDCRHTRHLDLVEVEAVME